MNYAFQSLRKTRKGFKSLRSIVARWARAREINAQNFFDPDRNVTVNHSSAAATGRRGFSFRIAPEYNIPHNCSPPPHRLYPPTNDQPIPTDRTVVYIYTHIYIIYYFSQVSAAAAAAAYTYIGMRRDSDRFRRRTHFGAIKRNI